MTGRCDPNLPICPNLVKFHSWQTTPSVSRLSTDAGSNFLRSSWDIAPEQGEPRSRSLDAAVVAAAAAAPPAPLSALDAMPSLVSWAPLNPPPLLQENTPCSLKYPEKHTMLLTLTNK